MQFIGHENRWLGLTPGNQSKSCKGVPKPVASVSITLDLYSHVLPNMQNELAGAVAKLLKREA